MNRLEAIILAGGLGTRLRGVIADRPKSMAPIHGKPFLAYLLDRLVVAGFARAILAVGYLGDHIREHFGDRYRSLPLVYSVETEPLGTGGAMRLAAMHATVPTVFVVNGDTYVEVGYRAMLAEHERARASLTIAVHEVPDAGRYGALEIAEDRIRAIREKGQTGPGKINAGVYLFASALLERFPLPSQFSFESDLLAPHVAEIAPLAFPVRGMFIDIGIPDDYARAQILLAGR